MSEDQPAASKPARRRGRKFLIALAVLLLAFGIFRGIVAYRAHAALSAFRAAGYPTSLKELAEYYPEPPPGENGAELLMRAFDLLKLPEDRESEPDIPSFGSADLPDPGQPLPPAMVQAIERLLAQNRDALDLIHRGAAMHAFRYPVDFERGFLTRHGEAKTLGSLRASTRLVELQEVLSLDRGGSDEAIECIATVVGLARSLEGHPFLLSYFTQTAVEALVAQDLQRLLSSGNLSETQLARLRRLVASMDADALHRAFRDEAALHLNLFIDTLDYPAPKTSSNWRQSVAWHLFQGTGLPALDRTAYLNLMQTTMSLAALDPPRRLTEARIALANPVSRWHMTTWFAAQVLAPVVEFDGRVTAMRQATLTALAVEDHRQRSGALPTALTDLVPGELTDVPLDPFDGQPLRYEIIERGYQIWSIGSDRLDDGGLTLSEVSATRPANQSNQRLEDIVFRVQRPAAATAPSP